MTRRRVWLGVLFSLCVGIITGTSVVTTTAQEPAAKPEAPAAKAEEPAKAEAPAAAPAPAPDPLATPPGPDPTGGSYTGASSTAALTKDGDKATMDTLAKDVKLLKIGLNIFWTLMCGFLVMFMQAGFALVETGLCRAKNAAHTMTMNFMVYAIGMIGFWICGFALMFGGLGAVAAWDAPNILNSMYSITLGGKTFDLFGYKGFFLSGAAKDASIVTIFLFQMVFM